jgi:hypothetical protein
VGTNSEQIDELLVLRAELKWVVARFEQVMGTSLAFPIAIQVLGGIDAIDREIQRQRKPLTT